MERYAVCVALCESLRGGRVWTVSVRVSIKQTVSPQRCSLRSLLAFAAGLKGHFTQITVLHIFPITAWWHRTISDYCQSGLGMSEVPEVHIFNDFVWVELFHVRAGFSNWLNYGVRITFRTLHKIQSDIMEPIMQTVQPSQVCECTSWLLIEKNAPSRSITFLLTANIDARSTRLDLKTVHLVLNWSLLKVTNVLRCSLCNKYQRRNFGFKGIRVKWEVRKT